jgi:xanthine dehydrogenase YagR molybdenum-binding subunit
MSTIKEKAQAVMQSAIQTAIELAPAAWLPGGKPDPLAGKHGLLGQPLSRLDGPLKVAGRARFAAEVPMPGLLYAAIVHSTIPRGRIASIDTSAAETAPGVALVMTYRNTPRMNPPALFGSGPDAAGPSDLPVMQDDRIRWNGHPVAVVLAETQELADHARTLVAVTYEAEAAVTSFDLAKADAHPPESILGEPAAMATGDAEAALAAAEFSVDLDYTTPFHNHNAIELHAATCVWEDGALTIHDASQLVTSTARTVADIFDIAHDKVRVISPYVGGGFGGKCLWWHQIIGAAAAKQTGRPVRLVLERPQMFGPVGARPRTEQHFVLAARRDGTLTAMRHDSISNTSVIEDWTETCCMVTRMLYAVPNQVTTHRIVPLNLGTPTFMRAPGETTGSFALESAMDELAAALKMDPLALRIKNYAEADPQENKPWSGKSLRECYQIGAEKFGWSRRTPAPRSMRNGGTLIGMGMATATYPANRSEASAIARILPDGTAMVASGTQDLGTGTYTVMTQVAADALGFAPENIRFALGDRRCPERRGRAARNRPRACRRPCATRRARRAAS